MNVWFEQKEMNARFEYITRMFEKYKPDVICLQEVIPSYIKIALKDDYVRKNYFVIQNDPTRWRGYDTYILSTIPFRLEVYDFETLMSRNLKVVILEVNNEMIHCGNVHLESMAHPDIRKKQLISCNEMLDSQSTSLLIGDFNIGADKNYSLIEKRRDLVEKGEDPYSINHSDLNEELENDVIKLVMPNFIDVWEEIHPNENGFTYDTFNNKMLENKGYQEMRYDRIFIKTNNWTVSSIEIIGTEQINEGEEEPIFPSDHFGLFMVMKHGKDSDNSNE